MYDYKIFFGLIDRVGYDIEEIWDCDVINVFLFKLKIRF